MKTWMFEMAVVAIVLIAVVIASGGGWVELIGATAVILTFGHAQVADRFAEQEAKNVGFIPFASEEEYQRTISKSVYCYKWTTRYLVSKELVWVIYFVVHRSWSALAGCSLFLIYPIWRRYWRRLKESLEPEDRDV